MDFIELKTLVIDTAMWNFLRRYMTSQNNDELIIPTQFITGIDLGNSSNVVPTSPIIPLPNILYGI